MFNTNYQRAFIVVIKLCLGVMDKTIPTVEQQVVAMHFWGVKVLWSITTYTGYNDDMGCTGIPSFRLDPFTASPCATTWTFTLHVVVIVVIVSGFPPGHYLGWQAHANSIH